MKIRINKSDLLKSLTTVVNINSKKNFDNFPNNFLCKTTKDSIIIKCSNSETSFKKEIQTKIINEGSFFTNSQKIYEVIKEFYDEELEIEVLKNNWILIKTKFSNVKIPNYDKNNIINIEFNNSPKVTSLLSKDFYKALKKTIDFVSVDPMRISLNGINIKFKDDKIYFISSDSYRASEFIINNKFEKNENILIPSSCFNELLNYLENEDATLEICSDENFLQIMGNKSTFKTKQQKLDYPNLDNIFKFVKVEKVLKIKIVELLREIRILKLIVDNFSNTMKFILSEDKLQIKSESMQTGQSDHFLECEFKGKLNIGLNINHTIKALQNMESAEFVEFHFKDSDKAITIKNNLEDNYQIVMMPMRISW